VGGIENDSGSRIDCQIDDCHREHEPVERIFDDYVGGGLSRTQFQFVHSVSDDSQQFEYHPIIDDGRSIGAKFFRSDDFGSIPGRFAGKKKKIKKQTKNKKDNGEKKK
jgi:hypothetical protein